MQAKISIHEVQKRIRESGLKATPQRLAIYRALLERHDHPGADQIYAAVHKQNPGISLGTVYKTMDTLVEAGLVSKVNSQDGVLRFDGKMNTHGHLHCTRTGRILDYEDDELETLLRDYFLKKKLPGFEVENFEVHLTGQLTEPSKK